jgi:transaldolase
MKFFIDTADINEIRKAKEYGVLDGVTTNPSLVAKVKRPYVEVLSEIVKEVPGPVSAEVISVECEGMLTEARQLAKMGDNVVIKIPLIKEGLKAVRILTAENIKTNVTLCFSALQALMAAKAGATYVSPFVGRLDDIAAEGMDVIDEIITIFNNYAFDTEVIVASIRNPLHIKHAALMGAHIATIPYSVFESIVKHPLTDAGVARFLEDYKKIPK